MMINSDESLNFFDVGLSYRTKLSVQDYSPKERIDGVIIHRGELFKDDGGSFGEVFRLEDSPSAKTLGLIDDFDLKQVNYANVLPGVVKAFHLHYNQEDVWFVLPSSKLLVGLLDVRKHSPTYQQSMRFVMGGGQNDLLIIPRGVAHGLANPWNESANMVYFVNQHFDIKNPDERRLPWDILGESFWQISKG